MSSSQAPTSHFGHPGRAVYDLETGKWLFQRDLRSARYVRIIEDKTPQADRAEDGRNDLSMPPETRPRRSRIQRFLHDTPGLQAAHDLVPELELESEVIETRTAQADPSVGDLMASGYVAGMGPFRNPPILVSVDGLNGDGIRMDEIQEDLRGWTKGYVSHLQVPRISGHSARWVGDGAAVRQICFSDAQKTTDVYFAVRFSECTVLFRPVLRENLVKSNAPRERRYPPSLIDPRPFIKIPASATGGASHADVAFCPLDQSWFAIIDQSLKWRAYMIEEDGEEDSRWKATVRAEGQLVLATAREPLGGREDGWARIIFLGDNGVLLACGRRMASIFSTRRGSPRIAPIPLPIEKGDWILDVRARPGRGDEIFILTTSGISWYRWSPTQKQDEMGNLELKLCWKHFRHDQDITLGLSLSEENNIICVVLFSRLHESITYLEFSDDAASTSPPKVSSPAILNAASRGIGDHVPNAAQTIIMNPLPIRGYRTTPRLSGDVDRGLFYNRRGFLFFSVFVLLKNQNRRHYLVSASKDPFPPQPPSVVLQRLARLHRSASVVEEDRFIAETDSDPDSDVATTHRRERRRGNIWHDRHDAFLYSLSRTARQLRTTKRTRTASLLERKGPKMSVGEFARLLKPYFRLAQATSESRFETISEVAIFLPNTSQNVRDESQALQDLWTEYTGSIEIGSSSLKLNNGAFKLIWDIPGPGMTSLWDVFVLFLALWGPKDPDAHMQICLGQKSALILSAAIDIFFATSTMVVRENLTTGSDVEESIAHSSIFTGMGSLYERLDLLRPLDNRKLRRKRRPTSDMASKLNARQDTDPEESEVIDTKPVVQSSDLEDPVTVDKFDVEEETEGVHAPLRGSSVADGQDAAWPTTDEGVDASTPLEQEILSFIDTTWPLRSNPDETDWDALARRYVPSPGEAEVPLDAQALAKQRRRKMREAMKLDRTAREDIEEEAIPGERTVRPAEALRGVWTARSSPTPRPPTIGISSQAVPESSSQVPASQVVRGRHGGKLMKVKKRRRRERDEGF